MRRVSVCAVHADNRKDKTMIHCAGPLDGVLAFMGAVGILGGVGGLILAIMLSPFVSERGESILFVPAVVMVVGTSILVFAIVLGLINQQIATCIKV